MQAVTVLLIYEIKPQDSKINMPAMSHADDVVIIVSANLSRSGEGGTRCNIRCMCKTMLNGPINSTAMNECVNTCAPSNPLPPGSEVRTYGATLMQKDVMATWISENGLCKKQKISKFKYVVSSLKT
ncbi:unnamed protein product, partial [Brenthis ino]